jgi:AraC family transcriptional regulator
MMLVPSSDSLFNTYDYADPSADDWQVCVDVHPIDSISRRRVSRNGMVAELVQVTRHSRIAFGYRGTHHLLVVCEHGVRSNGETIVEGLPQSNLRDMTRRLTVVPAGHAYSDWHEPRTLSRMLYFHFDPLRLPVSGLAPRLMFENPALFGIAIRLIRLFETSDVDRLYFEALATVLAHEVLHPNAGQARTDAPTKGGLAPWQQREVTAYIKSHLAEPIRLATLAKRVGLSSYHFCRAFKQSLGISPLQYHSQRRIEHARSLLATTNASVTEIGLTLGYSETSSFSAAFHRTTGTTPTAFRRSLAGPPVAGDSA